MKDKYSAVWVSHSSISDYLKCPRLYYLKNIYRSPKSGNKISIMYPPLALGQTVHKVIESLSVLPIEKRLEKPLTDLYESYWKEVSGELGGFVSSDEEKKFKDKGREMIKRVTDHPGPILKKAIKVRQDLPYFWLSEEDNIILCGKIDWLEYIEENDTVKIIDFKTGKYDEDPDSLQLPIYHLLVAHCQSKKISAASYWYLDRDDSPRDTKLPEYDESFKRVMEMAKRIALSRKLERFTCKKKDGCMFCRPFEIIVAGEGKFVGINDYRTDVYILNN